jgi:MFS superfamily sulfate permease-like transporter
MSRASVRFRRRYRCPPFLIFLFGATSDLFSAALAVAALAALESLLSAKVADGMADAPKHDPDRELFGQGTANVAAALFGGMPATGAIARTAVNVREGARTRAAAIIHSVFLIQRRKDVTVQAHLAVELPPQLPDEPVGVVLPELTE